RFTKVIIDYFMTRKPSISRRNRIHWHYVRDDALFSTIKVVSRHQKTQQYGTILPIELTTDEIRNRVPDVPSDDSEEEMSWNSSDDEDVGGHEEGKKTPEESDEERNDEEEQDLRLSEEARIQEEEDADHDVNINQGRGLQVTQSVKDTHVTLTLERLRSLETYFSEYRQTNLFADVVSAIPGIVHQYMTQQMKEVVQEAVQIQTDRLQDSLQRENDEFL
nr:hypothetical protein [Tanacetum cinerariifolium]